MTAIIVSVVCIVLDQISKLFVEKYLVYGESLSVIKNILNFTYINNDGVAFGMLGGMPWLHIPITIAVIIVILSFVFIKKINNKFALTSLGMIMGGGIGNLIDRIFRNGLVVDFLEFDFVNFAVFNVADTFIVCGAIIFCIWFVFVYEKEGVETENNNVHRFKRRREPKN